MNKIIIYTLEGCDKCASLKRMLQEKSMPYSEITCEKCPECCDSIEDLLNITHYPIVKIESDSKTYYANVSENNHQNSFLSVEKLFDYIQSKARL